MIVQNGGPHTSLEDAALFPFDDYSVPFSYRLKCGLVPAAGPYVGHIKVMGNGQPGAPDSENIKYYGGCRFAGDPVGAGEPDSSLCCAVIAKRKANGR